MIAIDGSQGEGGGQILRTALALSLVTGQPFRLDNIRARRPKPGLMRQHLACVEAAVAVGGGVGRALAINGSGDAPQVGDTALTFTPGPVEAGSYRFAIGSAGSCTLVLQTVMWPLLLADAPSDLQLAGGTHNPMAPSASFLQLLASCFAGGGPALFDIAIKRHGFYPAGGGELDVRLTPPPGGLSPLNLMERGPLLDGHAICLHAGIPQGVAERELGVLRDGLGWSDSQLLDRGLRSNEGPGNALMVVLRHAHCTEVVTACGDKRRRAEDVAHAVLKEALAYLAHEAPVGEHLADQLMIPMALAATHGATGEGGRYWATTFSEHARTNARIIETFLPVGFQVDDWRGGVLVSLA